MEGPTGSREDGPMPQNEHLTTSRATVSGTATTALITGAARGIGLEVARQLALTGVRVLITARDSRQAAEAASPIEGVEPLPVDLDVTDPAAVEAAVEALIARAGRLDILINNAAASPDRTDTATGADLGAAADVLQVNLFGAWRMTQALLPLLRASDHPRIVNVGSGAGSHADERFGLSLMGGSAATHAVSKAALNAFTAVLAAELADTPVIVNVVCPGVTATAPGAEHLGARPVEASAPGVVWAATLPDDGPRGGFFRDFHPLGW
ncbi:SDR family oxidoreductase [Nocardiopsis tropica]